MSTTTTTGDAGKQHTARCTDDIGKFNKSRRIVACTDDIGSFSRARRKLTCSDEIAAFNPDCRHGRLTFSDEMAEPRRKSASANFSGRIGRFKKSMYTSEIAPHPGKGLIEEIGKRLAQVRSYVF